MALVQLSVLKNVMFLIVSKWLQFASFLGVQSGICIIFIDIYEGESNENLKSVIKVRNTAQLSCKLTTVILMV